MLPLEAGWGPRAILTSDEDSKPSHRLACGISYRFGYYVLSGLALVTILYCYSTY